MMKLKSITIEGMHNVLEKTYNFNDYNYLFGNNGAGKSTVLQAIQLALLGYIPGTGKKNQDIFRHARSKAMSVTALLHDLERSSDVTVTRTFVSSGTSVTASLSVSPEIYNIEGIVGELELPVFNFNEFVGMTANNLKKWFIDFLPSVGSSIDWQTALKDKLGDMNLIDKDLISNVLKDIDDIKSARQLDGVELVKAVNDKLKEKLSFEKGQLERTQSTIQSLVFYDDTSSDSDTASMREELKNLNNLRTLLFQYNSTVSSNLDVKQKLAMLDLSSDSIDKDENYIQHIKERDAAMDKIGELENSIDDINSKISSIDFDIVAKQAIVSSKGICPYTKSECSGIVKIIEKLNSEIDELNNNKSDLKKQLDDMNVELAKVNSKYRKVTNNIVSLQTRYNSRQSLLSQLKPECDSPTKMSDDDILAKIAELTETITKVEANKKYNELINKLTADKYRMENTIEAYKLWIKLTDANGLQTTIMFEPFVNLSIDMDKYIQVMFNDASVKSHFHLSDKANSFSFGIKKVDKYIPFDLLSSGEKCLFTVALMMCLISRSNSPLKLILIDDLLDHLDDANAKSLFASLNNVDDIQIILAGVQKCDVDNANEIIIEVK